MSPKIAYLLKNVGILSLSSFASKVLSFFFVPIYTYLVTAQEYGTVDLVGTTVAICSPFLSFNITDAVMRYTMDKNVSTKAVACVGVKYLIFSCVAFFFLLWGFAYTGWWSELDGLFVLVYLSFVTATFSNFFIQFAKGLERVKDMAVAGVLSTIVSIIFNLLFLWYLKLGIVGIFLASIVTSFIQMAYMAIQIRFWDFIADYSIDKKLQREMLLYAIPLIITTLGWWANGAFSKYVVALFCGVSANGLLAVAYKLPQIIAVVQGIFIQAWQITAIKEYGEDNANVFYGSLFVKLNLIMCVLCAMLIVISEPLARFLFAKEFYQAWQYAPFLLISCVLNMAGGLMGPIFAAKKDTKSMAVSAIFGSVANIIFSIFLVGMFGVQGGTIAVMLSSLVIFLYRKYAVKNEMFINEYWKVLLTWGLLCIESVIMIYWGNWLYPIIFVVLIVAVNWGEVVNILLFGRRCVVNRLG